MIVPGMVESQADLLRSVGIISIRNPSWWAQKSKLERRLFLLFLFLFIICIVLLTCLLIKGHHRPDICLTRDCVMAAASLIKSMDLTVNPCDDFYQFACGGFIKCTRIPDDESQVSGFSIVDHLLNDQLKLLVEDAAPSESGSEPRPFILVKNLYKSCLNKTFLEIQGLEPIKKFLEQLGQWPVVQGDTWDATKFNWTDLVRLSGQFGFSTNYFIEFYVGTDDQNSTMRSIILNQAHLGLDREYLTGSGDAREVQAYAKFQINLAILFGADMIRAEKEMSAILEFEKNLANFTLPKEELRDMSKLYHPMTIQELGSKFPSIPWLTYINNLLPPKVSPVDLTERVIVTVPSYLEKFEIFIGQTDTRIVANYQIWRTLKSVVQFLNQPARNLQQEYLAVLTGQETEKPRWRTCIDIVSDYIPEAVGSMYVRRHFQIESLTQVNEMVTAIRSEFLQTLNKIQWMDSITKENARKKALAMTAHIGYPRELLNDSKLDNYYKNLDLSPSNYLQNILNLLKFSTDLVYGKLREPVDKLDWTAHAEPAVVNAFYNPQENSIEFPAGILQGSFFTRGRPMYMNFGGIAWVIGHEIIHGFDDQGRQVDGDGNVKDWWEEKTAQAYLEKAECIINQYGNYSVKQLNMTLNGINTQGENIADNGGLKLAYKSYLNWIERNGEEMGLGGLDYTPRQLFWISAATTWCGKMRLETLKSRITSDEHAPMEFRVRGPMSNSWDFAKDFNCPIGSPMNVVNKCHVW